MLDFTEHTVNSPESNCMNYLDMCITNITSQTSQTVQCPGTNSSSQASALVNDNSRSTQWGNLDSPNNPTCRSLDCGRKTEYPQETQADKGRICKLHAQRPGRGVNPGHSRCEAMAQPTAPQHCIIYCISRCAVSQGEIYH